MSMFRNAKDFEKYIKDNHISIEEISIGDRVFFYQDNHGGVGRIVKEIPPNFEVSYNFVIKIEQKLFNMYDDKEWGHEDQYSVSSPDNPALNKKFWYAKIENIAHFSNRKQLSLF